MSPSQESLRNECCLSTNISEGLMGFLTGDNTVRTDRHGLCPHDCSVFWNKTAIMSVTDFQSRTAISFVNFTEEKIHTH